MGARALLLEFSSGTLGAAAYSCPQQPTPAKEPLFGCEKLRGATHFRWVFDRGGRDGPLSGEVSSEWDRRDRGGD